MYLCSGHGHLGCLQLPAVTNNVAILINVCERVTLGCPLKDGMTGGHGLCVCLISLSFVRMLSRKPPAVHGYFYLQHLVFPTYQVLFCKVILITTGYEHLLLVFGSPLSCLFLSFVYIVLGLLSFLDDL